MPVFINGILILGRAILGLLVFQFAVIVVFYHAYFYSQQAHLSHRYNPWFYRKRPRVEHILHTHTGIDCLNK